VFVQYMPCGEQQHLSEKKTRRKLEGWARRMMQAMGMTFAN